ncbi:hypothetical protein WM40_24540 [Robbsia andropogonis]|uniref:Uncharacterized protein n=1 Tax=Robbsia andropogonis TaxID=28092 RepID=A0A0F5JU75_9BURK|nr:hypothetical protein WM40_24540 [Robbsia andropogonis]
MKFLLQIQVIHQAQKFRFRQVHREILQFHQEIKFAPSFFLELMVRSYACHGPCIYIRQLSSKKINNLDNITGHCRCRSVRPQIRILDRLEKGETVVQEIRRTPCLAF